MSTINGIDAGALRETIAAVTSDPALGMTRWRVVNRPCRARGRACAPSDHAGTGAGASGASRPSRTRMPTRALTTDLVAE